MKEDITKASLAVLMILALIISVLSTFTVLKSLNGFETSPSNPAEAAKVKEKGPTGASLSLSIAQPEQPSIQTASVSLSIKR